MKELTPGSGKKPAGWQFVFDQFNRLRAIAKKAGVNVEGWALYHPDGIKERFRHGWEMRYSITDVHQRIFLAYDAREAAKVIHSMIPLYPIHQRTVKSEIKPVVKRNPATDPVIISKMFEEWSVSVKKVGHSISPSEWEKVYAPKFRLLSQQAGILPMSIRQYLTNHPHAQYWPAPPTSQEQLRRRNEELQRMVREQEARKRQDYL